MGKQGGELKWWTHYSSSTVLLDPAAFVESWKQQIQGKDGIPTEHQRLIFAYRVPNQEVLSYTCKRSSRCPRAEEHAASEFLKELGSWEAILKDDNHTIAKLLHPLVAAEEQVAADDEKIASRLSCQTAMELRSMGIPCNVYYLFFNQWIPTSLKNGKCCKVTSSLNMQIDKDFQNRRFQIRLLGRLNGNKLPLPFVYRMNGGEVAARLSMQEQVAQYRQGQQTRHRLGLSTQSVGKGVEDRDVPAVVENIGPAKELVDDFYCPCGKDLEFTVIISNDRQLKCFVLTVIQIPAQAPRKLEHLEPYVPGRRERSNSGLHESSVYRLSSSCTCERALCTSQISFSESLPMNCCGLAGKSAGSVDYSDCREPLGLCSSEAAGPNEFLESSTNSCELREEQVSNNLTEIIGESLPEAEDPVKLSAKKKKKKKGKRNSKLRDNGKSTLPEGVDSSLPSSSVQNSSGSSLSRAELGNDSEIGDIGVCSTWLGAEEMVPSNQDLLLSVKCARESSKHNGCCMREPGNILHSNTQCTLTPACLKLPTRGVSIKEGLVSAPAESSYFEKIPENTTHWGGLCSSEECSKAWFGRTGIQRHGKEVASECRELPWSACRSSASSETSADFRDPYAVRATPDHTYMCSKTTPSQTLFFSQPSIRPILVDMVLQDSFPPASSSADGEGSHLPFRELVGNLETCSNSKEKLNSDSYVSARGGHSSSGAGSRNGRSGADGSGNRNSRGPEDRKGTSGYHGSGQGSSGSSNGSGPGGSSTSGSSGGSGGGNGNRGGGRGASGGGWDGRRAAADGGNSSKDGDNDERHRNSFQLGSNGEVASESLQRKKGASLEHGHGRKGGIGIAVGDHSLNGSHGSIATSSGSGKENLNTFWQKIPNPSDDGDFVDQAELTDVSVPANLTASGERIQTRSADPKLHSSTLRMNGSLYDGPNKNESTVGEKMESANYPVSGKGVTKQDSFVKVLKQSIADSAQDSNPVSSSNQRLTREVHSSGSLPDQDGLKGAWQKKISWDENPQSSLGKYVADAASHGSPLKGKLYVKPVRNGIVTKALYDTANLPHPKSSSAPSTPNGFQDDVPVSREFNYIHPWKQSEGRIHHSSSSGMALSNEQSRLQSSGAPLAKHLGDPRAASEELTQRAMTWKSRRPPGEQEKYPSREKPAGDRERTVHWAQKWVPVEQKVGGLAKAPVVQSNSSSNGSVGITENNCSKIKETEHDLDSEQVVWIDGDSSRAEILCSSSPFKSLRRLQTFPSGNSAAMYRVAESDGKVLDVKKPSASVATERSSGSLEQANLRSLLPRERAVDNRSIHSTLPQSRCSISMKSCISQEVDSSMSQDIRASKEATSVKRVLSPAEEDMQRVSRAVLDAVLGSCKDRWAAEGTMREVGCHIAEFEKVLEAVAPSFLPVLDSSLSPGLENGGDNLSSRSRSIVRSKELSSLPRSSEEDHCSLCRCRVLDSPLSSVWKWYEEPSYYGVEVRTVDCQRIQKNGEAEEPFLAYYVPYLSGLQLFGSQVEGNSRGLSGSGGTKGKVDTAFASQSQPTLSGTDVLATLFPSPVCLAAGTVDCTVRDNEILKAELLYEFYEADLPQVRQPLFPKVEELLKGVSSLNSHSSGDPATLDRLRLGDLHPASWFAVAWYPIYRISDGPLRAVFLTYHSFSHFAPTGSLSCLRSGTGTTDDNVSLPVVGMECYNLQAEPWLSVSGHFARELSKVTESLSVNPFKQLENRIGSLQNVAALMAKGIPDLKSASPGDGNARSAKFKHSDYEFFVKRRR